MWKENKIENDIEIKQCSSDTPNTGGISTPKSIEQIPRWHRCHHQQIISLVHCCLSRATMVKNLVTLLFVFPQNNVPQVIRCNSLVCRWFFCLTGSSNLVYLFLTEFGTAANKDHPNGNPCALSSHCGSAGWQRRWQAAAATTMMGSKGVKIKR